MKKYYLSAVAALSMVVAGPAVAAETTLYNQTNLSQQFVTPLTLIFVADSTETTLNFGGYNIPSSTALVNLFVALTGTPKSTVNNLLDTDFTYTPAASGAWATIGSTGIYGSSDLVFGGGTVGSYDVFSQSFATTVGSSYTLSFSMTQAGRGENGLRITQGTASAVGAVPEPGTWALMLLGFGAIGFGMRRQRSMASTSAFSA